MRTITYFYVAETSVTIDIPDDYPTDVSQWTDEQREALSEIADEKVHGEHADWFQSWTEDLQINQTED